jgi:tRNA-splicing ligase RtcB
MPPTVRTWLCGRLDDGVARQIEQVAGQADVGHVAVMPDVHMGRVIPNGIAVATRRLVYPDLVGADIGCGIAAIGFDALADDVLVADRETVLERLLYAVPTLKHRPDHAAQHRQCVDSLGALSSESLVSVASRDGVYQLGTLGRGNHFLELAADEQGRLWAVVHTGSRAMGQAITTHHLACATHSGAIPGDSSNSTLPSLSLDTTAGLAYFADMEWACRYAAANRAAILNAVADILEDLFGVMVDALSFVDSPHNTATLECVGGVTAIVHRKSANHASDGRRGIVAGSMAVGTRIVTGLGNAGALESSAHGAGRVMSRGDAMERLGARDVEARMGRITYRRSMANEFRDEAPSAYRELHEVMRAQRDLVKTERTLTPIINDKRV